MKKIAIISFYNIYSSKGVEKFLKVLYEGLKDDFKIDTFSLTHDFTSKGGKNEYYVPNLFGLGFFIYIIYVGVIIFFKRNNYDFIVFNNINGFIPSLIKKLGFWGKKVKIITIGHNVKKSYYDSANPGKYSISQKVLLYVDSICFNYTDVVVATSYGVKRQLIESYNVSEKKITTIVNTLVPQPDKMLPLTKKERRLVFVSGDHQRKGIDVILALGGILEKNNDDIIISIIGPKLQNDICKNIKSIGYMTNEDLARYISESLISILPSRNEGLPLGILESVSVGTPFLASKESNLEMLDGIAGRIIPNRDALLYYDGMKEIMQRYNEFQDGCFIYLEKNKVKDMITAYSIIFS